MLWHKAQGAGGLVGGVETPSYTFTDFASTTSSTQVQTFSGMSLGTPDTNRKIAVVVEGYNTTGADYPSITVGGVSASLVTPTRTGVLIGQMGLVDFPTGTTADVVVNFGNSTLVRAALAVYAVYGDYAAAQEIATGGFSITSMGTGSFSVSESDIFLASIYAAPTISVTGFSADDSNDFGTREIHMSSFGPAPSAQTLSYSWSWTVASGYRYYVYRLSL